MKIIFDKNSLVYSENLLQQNFKQYLTFMCHTHTGIRLHRIILIMKTYIYFIRITGGARALEVENLLKKKYW